MYRKKTKSKNENKGRFQASPRRKKKRGNTLPTIHPNNKSNSTRLLTSSRVNDEKPPRNQTPRHNHTPLTFLNILTLTPFSFSPYSTPLYKLTHSLRPLVGHRTLINSFEESECDSTRPFLYFFSFSLSLINFFLFLSLILFLSFLSLSNFLLIFTVFI